VLARDWESYPILTLPEVPRVEVHLINHPDEPSLGAGEVTMGSTAAAIGNALHHALGVRLRDLPLTRERILTALSDNDQHYQPNKPAVVEVISDVNLMAPTAWAPQ
jgi:CO/xanthine dehydrogenase Mo-binding subunit